MPEPAGAVDLGTCRYSNRKEGVASGDRFEISERSSTLAGATLHQGGKIKRRVQWRGA